eukprot:COSAG01_NODE_7975_length_2968_cov_1.410945_4_plen_87_part_00
MVIPIRTVLLLLLLQAAVPAALRTAATPTPEQLAYMDTGLTMFVHFSPNTFMNHTYEHNCDPADLKINPYESSTPVWSALVVLAAN